MSQPENQGEMSMVAAVITMIFLLLLVFLIQGLTLYPKLVWNSLCSPNWSQPHSDSVAVSPGCCWVNKGVISFAEPCCSYNSALRFLAPLYKLSPGKSRVGSRSLHKRNPWKTLILVAHQPHQVQCMTGKKKKAGYWLSMSTSIGLRRKAWSRPARSLSCTLVYCNSCHWG